MRVLTVILLPLFLVSSLYASEVDVDRLHKARWINLETGNFSVISDAGEKKAGAMAEELEKFYFFVTKSLGYKQNSLASKVTVILARNSSGLEAMGVPEEYGGVAVFLPERSEYTLFADASNFVASRRRGQSYGRSVILHELMHLIHGNEAIGLAAPPWYSEGIADYYGTFAHSRGQVVLGKLDLLQYRFLRLLKSSGRYRSVESESLFRATHEDLPVMDGASWKQSEELADFYARAAAVVHYLNSDPERYRQMYIYLHLLGKGASIDESFAHAFQTSFEELDERVSDYLEGRFVKSRTFPVGRGGIEFPDVPYEVRELDSREAMRMLVSGIQRFSDSLLGEGNREKMLEDVERLYPGLL